MKYFLGVTKNDTLIGIVNTKEEDSRFALKCLCKEARNYGKPYGVMFTLNRSTWNKNNREEK